MTFYKNNNSAIFYSSVNEITQEVWTELQCSASVYFHPDYLISLEKNNPQVNGFQINIKKEVNIKKIKV